MSHNFYFKDKNYSYILIKVTPNSKKNEIQKTVEVKTLMPVTHALKINISSPAKDDKANKELIKFLSKELNIKKNQILIEKGTHSSIKLIKLPKDFSFSIEI